MAETAQTIHVAASANRRRFRVAIGFGVAFVLLGGILVTTRNLRREAAEAYKQRTCLRNLSRIGLAVFAYQQAHAGASPAALEELVAAGELPAEALVCPFDTRGGGHSGSSYVYVGKDVPTSAGWDVVVAYDREMNHDGANVLCADGHVDWAPARAMQYLFSEVAAGRLPARIAPPSSTQMVPTSAPSSQPTGQAGNP